MSEPILLSIPSQSGADFNLSCQVETPRRPSKGIVVVCHGLLGHRDSRVCRELANCLLEQGPFAVARLDFRGNGWSGGRTAYGNYEEEKQDLHDVIEYLRKDEQCSHLGPIRAVVGHSKAASVVLMYAQTYARALVESSRRSLEPDCKSMKLLVVGLSGRFHMAEAPTQRFTEEQLRNLETEGQFIWKRYKTEGGTKDVDYVVTRNDLQRRAALDMRAVSQEVAVLQREGFIRILSVHGSNDRVIPMADAYQYAEMWQDPSCLMMVEGMDHFYENPEEIQLTGARILQLLSTVNECDSM